MTAALCMAVLVASVIIALVVITRAAIRNGEEGRERWGTIEMRHQASRGPGAFRSSTLSERRPHGAPWLVWVAGLAGAWMGPARAIAFAPMLNATALDSLSRATHDGPRVLPIAALLGAAGSLLLAWFVFSASMSLLRCVRGGGGGARRVGLIVLALDLTVLACLLAAAEPIDRVAHAASALLVVGAIHGALLALAGDRTERRQAVLDDEEWAALPDE